MGASRMTVGVDLGGTNIRAALVDADATIRSVTRTRVGDERTPEVVVARIREAVREVLERVSMDIAGVAGVGVGVAGQLRGETGIVVAAPNLGWREVPLGELLRASLGRPVTVVNDVEAVAWGEVQHGAARSHRNVLVVFAGTGVGAGLVMNGQLVRGATGVAAEIGHVKVGPPDGEPCGCGGRGCLEAYLGGANLSSRLRRESRQGWSSLLEEAGGEESSVHPGLVETLCARGDGRATRLFEELAGAFGLVLANAVTLLNPSALVLGGTVMDGCPTLRSWSERVLRERVLPVAGDAVQVLPAGLGDDAGIIGAAALALQAPGGTP